MMIYILKLRLPDLLINSAHSTELQDLKDEIDDLENQANELWEVSY